MSSSFSRRDFLKTLALGAASLLLEGMIPTSFLKDPHTYRQEGRVAAKSIGIYEEPSFESPRVDSAWRDLVFPITGVEISNDASAYNRVWYHLGEKGYAYSGWIQPVQTILNTPVLDIPQNVLAEVTVPYTDARSSPRDDAPVVYRLYYGSTHWVSDVISCEDRPRAWYRLVDDKTKEEGYFVPASHLRIIPENELLPLSTDIPSYQKYIEVRLSQQLLLAYENHTLVFATRVSTGTLRANGEYYTPTGHFFTKYKRPSRHMAAGNLANRGYDLPGVPWVMYITNGGISFHGTYWHNDFGHPHSHGCINLPIEAARWLFRWTTPVVPPDKPFVSTYTGTHVEIIR
jgi:hypothetical protein